MLYYKIFVVFLFICLVCVTMPTKEELENMLTNAMEKLEAAEEKLKTYADEEKKPLVLGRDKKIEKFDGSGDFIDFCDEITHYLDSRFRGTDSQKASYLFDHLSGKARKEVKFRLGDVTKATVDDILVVLDNVFGIRETTTQLLQKFYSRNQKKTEQSEDYAYALIDIMRQLQHKAPKQYSNVDEMMKEKFADGVLDVSLKRELKRLNSDRPGLKFWELRDRARKWLEDGSSSVKTDCDSKTDTTSVDMKKVMEQMQKLCEMDHELINTHDDESNEASNQAQRFYKKSFPKPNQFRATRSGQFKVKTPGQTQQQPQTPTDGENCYYCGLPNHYAKHCRKQLKEKGMLKQENEVEVEDNLNLEHPV